MKARVLFLLLVSAAAARADKGYVVERDQSLTSVEMHGVSAVSRALAGRVREIAGGALRMEVRLPLSSFVGDRPPPTDTSGAQEIVFEGTSERPDKGGKLHLMGNLTLHGVTRPLDLWLTISRSGQMAFGHAYFPVRLREFGFPLPAGINDEVRVQIDAALRPDSALVRG